MSVINTSPYTITTDDTTSGTTLTISSGVWAGTASSPGVDWATIYPADPYGLFRYAVRQYFTDAGITLFPPEEELICFYTSRRKEVDAVKRECDEWFPIIARKRIVE